MVVIGGDAKTGNLQRPLLNVHSAVVRIAGMLMTKFSLGGLGVGLGVPVTLWSILITTS